MMFWNDNSSGPAPEHLIQHSYTHFQRPVSSSSLAVVGVGVRRHNNYSRHGDSRRYDYPSASSINNFRTATSAPPAFPMPPKHPLSGSPSGTPAKLPKTETKPEDFSNSVKKRLQSSTRTGQACDRCKIRKIRCDGLPGGCSPCLNNNTECRTTDRITGRAAPRGYVDSIEAQNREQANRIRELENQLMQHGIEIKPSTIYQDQSISYNYSQSAQNGHATIWNLPGQSNAYAPPSSSHILPSTQQETNMFRALPAFRAGCPGDNYLGVSSGNSNLSSIKGTALSILGMEIDIADFASQDIDEPDQSMAHPQLYNKSYQAFLQTALNINPKLEKPKLPERSEGITYAQWFFRVFNPYLPILHKGKFMALLMRTYDDPSFRPSIAETVMIHCVFAIIFFQYAVRNFEDANNQAYLNAQSNLHYHYSLGMFYELSCSHTMQDAQAMTLICAHLRNFPKPGASWMLSMTTLALCIELGLHRSAKRWTPEHNHSGYDIEIRKRVFWSILTIHMTLSGKLGRPMSLRLDDIDVEIPDPMDDEVMAEIDMEPASRSGKCVHRIGIEHFKINALFIEMYSTIYAVRRNPETYIETVNRLEAKVNTWRSELPSELVRGGVGSNVQEHRIFTCYGEVWFLEFRMLLRHPAVSMTLDAAFNADSMRICVESAHQMLTAVKEIQAFKCLDTTWYNSAVLVMAITTNLFAQWEKRYETSAADLASLRREMDEWLNIMGDVGAQIGSGSRLREAVRVVTDGTIGLLSRSLQSKTGGYISQGSGQDLAKSAHNSNQSNGYGGQGYNSTISDSSQPANGNQNGSSYLTSNNQLAPPQTPYPTSTQYDTYPEPSSGGTGLQYTSQESHNYNGYSTANADSVEAPLLAAFAAQASQVAPTTWQRPQQQVHSGSQSWQQWTSTMASGNLDSQDCYSASALIQLGGRDLGSTDVSGNVAGLGDMSSAQNNLISTDGGNMGGPTTGGVGAWPLNIFDIGPNGSPP